MPRAMLTAYQKERIIASYELGWRPRDIAEVLGLSAGAVKMYRSRHEKLKGLEESRRDHPGEWRVMDLAQKVLFIWDQVTPEMCARYCAGMD